MALASDVVGIREPVGESPVSCISWAAILAGAAAAIATTIVLAVLGVGVGLTAASPWSGLPSGTTLAVSGAVWLVVTQWLSAGLGGYLAGRLRTKWSGVRTEEVFFRDTAHGFLAWCVATVVVVVVVASSTTSLISGASKAVGGVVASAAQGAGQGAAQQGIAQAGQGADPTAYFTDMLFRSTTPSNEQRDVRAEAARILAAGLAEGDVSQADRAYLAQLVAARTGLSQPDAEKRVNEVISAGQAAKQKAKEVADAARKASATFALFSVLSMIVGAFIAAVGGAIGGHARRDAYI